VLGAHSCLEKQLSGTDGFTAFLFEQLAPLGRIMPRRMFGKTGLFCDGVMFGMVADGALFVRVDDQNHAVFQEAAAHPPLNYTKAGKTIDLAFWRVPDRLFDEPEELVVWARAAVAAATRVSAKRPRRPGKINCRTGR
jgi:DNA transformation protein